MILIIDADDKYIKVYTEFNSAEKDAVINLFCEIGFIRRALDKDGRYTHIVFDGKSCEKTFKPLANNGLTMFQEANKQGAKKVFDAVIGLARLGIQAENRYTEKGRSVMKPLHSTLFQLDDCVHNYDDCSLRPNHMF